MLCPFLLTHHQNETMTLFNTAVASCGVPPVIIRISDIDVPYNIPEIDSQVISASMFLPPVDIFKLLVDATPENIAIYDNEYLIYLDSDIQLETIAMIISTAMTKFSNTQNLSPIIFEIPYDTFESCRLQVFLNFLYVRFGIGFNNTPHNLSFEPLSNMLNMIYTFNLISTQDFLACVPKLPNGNYNVFDININKVKEELNR